MEWTDIVHFHTWPSTDANIRMCKVGAKSDYPFSFCAKNKFFENFDLLWGMYQEEWTDIARLRTRSKFDKNITIYQVWAKSDTPFESYRVHQPARPTDGRAEENPRSIPNVLKQI